MFAAAAIGKFIDVGPAIQPSALCTPDRAPHLVKKDANKAPLPRTPWPWCPVWRPPSDDPTARTSAQCQPEWGEGWPRCPSGTSDVCRRRVSRPIRKWTSPLRGITWTGLVSTWSRARLPSRPHPSVPQDIPNVVPSAKRAFHGSPNPQLSHVFPDPRRETSCPPATPKTSIWPASASRSSASFSLSSVVM